MDPNSLPSLRCHHCHVLCPLPCHCWNQVDTEPQQGLPRPEHQILAPVMSCSPLALAPHFNYSPPAPGSAHRAPSQAQQCHGSLPQLRSQAQLHGQAVQPSSAASSPHTPHPAPRGAFLELCHHTDPACSRAAPSVGTARGTRASAPKKCLGSGQSPGKPHVWSFAACTSQSYNKT